MTIYSLSYSFPNFKPAHFSMSNSNSYFITCIQVSQQTGEIVWYSRLFKNFPQFVIIHTVKGFSVVNEAEVDIFLEFPCFLCDLVNVGNLTSDSSASSKPSLYIWSSQIMYRWSLAWRILSITLLACEMSTTVLRNSSLNILLHFPSLRLECKLTFSSPVALGWVLNI